MSDHAAPYAPLNVGYVAKTITYIALAGVLSLIAALADETITPVELIGIAIAFLGAIPVYWTTAARWLKTAVAFGLAGLQALVLIVTTVTDFGDITLQSWLVVLVAALAGIGVAIVPNSSAQPTEPASTFITGDIVTASDADFQAAELHRQQARVRQAARAPHGGGTA
jgi:hypothetical protein